MAAELEKSKLLVCISDPPEFAESLLRAAQLLAEALESEVQMLHVGIDTPETRSKLENYLAEKGITYSQLIISSGKPASVICRVAKELNVQLIVAGALKRETMVRDIVGSTARRVARRAHCSVFLLVRPFNPSTAWEQIVVALEFTERARALMRSLFSIGRLNTTSTVNIVHESETYSSHFEQSHSSDPGWKQQQRIEAAQQSFKLANFLEDLTLGDTRLKTITLQGMPIREIIRYAEEIRGDMLALLAPSRKLGFFDKLFGHSVEIALDKLPCSLLIYRSTSSSHR